MGLIGPALIILAFGTRAAVARREPTVEIEGMAQVSAAEEHHEQDKLMGHSSHYSTSATMTVDFLPAHTAYRAGGS